MYGHVKYKHVCTCLHVYASVCIHVHTYMYTQVCMHICVSPDLFNFLTGCLFILVEIQDKKLKQQLLDTKCVYILDCWSDEFIW